MSEGPWGCCAVVLLKAPGWLGGWAEALERLSQNGAEALAAAACEP